MANNIPLNKINEFTVCLCVRLKETEIGGFGVGKEIEFQTMRPKAATQALQMR